MRAPTDCLRCKGRLQAGFVVDNHDNQAGLQTWFEGEPKRGWFGLKLRGLRRHTVTTYCCTQCGHLESHALPSSDVSPQ